MKIAAILFFCLFPLTALTAQDIDENALFGSPAENIVGSEKVMNDAIASNSQNQGLTISGRVKSDNGYTLSRKFITNWSTNADSNLFNSSLSGNLLVDIRLRQGIKAFANVELGYYPLGQLVPHYYTEYDTNGFPLSNRILVDTNYTTLVLK